MKLSTSKVLDDIKIEREHQDKRWGGPNHDDSKSISDFAQYIQDYAGWARMNAINRNVWGARKKLVQVAALAVAAIEAIDRNTKGKEAKISPTYSGESHPFGDDRINE